MSKSFICIEKIVYYTCYAKDEDITFVMKDKIIEDQLITTECIGWYHGEPDAKMSQEVAEGRLANMAELEPDMKVFKEAGNDD